jgi:hypothetical protein
MLGVDVDRSTRGLWDPRLERVTGPGRQLRDGRGSSAAELFGGGPVMKHERIAGDRSYIDRPARVSLRCNAVLTEADGCRLDVVIIDVSRNGFRLQSRCELERGAEVMLEVPKSPPVRAVIRWTCGHEAGGVFLEPVSL